jgi:hypothetical protein
MQFAVLLLHIQRKLYVIMNRYLKQVLEVMLIGKHGKEYLEQRGSFYIVMKY